MKTPEIFTINAEEMPSKSVSVSFKEPSFADRREASRRYPTASRVGYSMEELLLAMCLTGFNDNPLPAVPTDPIQYLKQLPHIDGQYLFSTFLSMFTLQEDQAKSAKELGTKMKISADSTHSIPQGVLPVEGTSVSFHAPTLGNRMDLDRAYPGADSNCGYSLEEMLFAACIDTVDGDPKPNNKEHIAVLDHWTHLDAQYALAVFISAVTIDKEEDNSARTLGKSLRDKTKAVSQKSTKVSSSKTSKGDTATQA
jgi:hypothetical protein